MPQTGKQIQFKAGTYANYAAITSKDVNTVYFCTDASRLFVGDVEYTRPLLSGAGAPAATIALDNPKDTIYYDTTNKELYITVSGGAWIKVTTRSELTTLDTTLRGLITALTTKFDNHIADKNNPHNVTAAGIGAATTEELAGVNTTAQKGVTDAAAAKTAADNAQATANAAKSQADTNKANIEALQNKPSADITSADVTAWNAEKGAKEAAEAAQETADGAVEDAADALAAAQAAQRTADGKADTGVVDGINQRLGTAEGEIDELQRTVEGLTGAMHFLGITTTIITDGATTTTVTVNNETVTAASGDVVIYGDQEYVFNGTTWALFGDTSDYLLKNTASETYETKGDATAKLNEAKAYADTQRDAAKSHADSVANTAKTEAIAAAATDATTKANNAVTTANAYTDQQVLAAALVWGEF